MNLDYAQLLVEIRSKMMNPHYIRELARGNVNALKIKMTLAEGPQDT